MSYNQKKQEYNLKYQKENMKRISLVVQKEQYSRLKSACDSTGESVNGFIKKAIDLRINNENL